MIGTRIALRLALSSAFLAALGADSAGADETPLRFAQAEPTPTRSAQANRTPLRFAQDAGEPPPRSRAAQPEGSDSAPLSAAQQIEQVFRFGLSSLSRGDPEAAIRAFRSILAVNPNLSRVRLELARAYFVAEKWELSRAEFFTALSGDLPTPVRRNVLRFLRNIDQRRGVFWSFDASLIPGLGESRTHDSDTVSISLGGTPLPFTIRRREPSPIAIRATLGAERRRKIGLSTDQRRRSNLFGFVEGNLTVLEAPSDHNDYQVATVRIGLRSVTLRSTLRAGLRGSISFSAGERHQDEAGPFIGGEHRTDSGGTVFWSASTNRVDNSVRNRSGWRFNARLGASESLGGRARLGGAADYERLGANASHFSHSQWRIETFAQMDLGSGFLANGRIYHLWQNFDSAHLPFFQAVRRDTKIGATLRIIKTDILLLDRFSPYVEVGAARRSSSIDTEAYKERSFFVGFTRTL